MPPPLTAMKEGKCTCWDGNKVGCQGKDRWAGHQQQDCAKLPQPRWNGSLVYLTGRSRLQDLVGDQVYLLNKPWPPWPNLGFGVKVVLRLPKHNTESTPESVA